MAEEMEKLHNRVHCCSADDEMFLGFDDEIANSRSVVFFVSWKRIDGGFELRRSGSASENFREIERIDDSENVLKRFIRVIR